MAHSTRGSGSLKIRKPHKTSDALTARADGRWCKHYKTAQGEWRWFYFRGTEQEALDEWNRQKPDLLAGRDPLGPSASAPGGTTISELANKFLHHKKLRLDSKELTLITWKGYEAVAKLLVTEFPRNKPADSLSPPDFQKLRAKLAKEYGPVTLGNRINVVRMIFKYGLKAGLLTKPAEFSVEFDKPSAKALRQAKAAKGERLFKPEQIKKLLKKAEPHMVAMILLAINGGLGNNDLALLTPAAFDFDGAWLDYPRPKTGMPRRVPLWLETFEAVKVAIAKRRKPKDPADANLLFIGAHGSSYVSHTGGHRIAHEFSGLCEDAGVEGRVFYDLRRTFETIADNRSRDRDGVKAIMGHAPASGDMSAVYRQGFDDDRLRSIVDCVHGWLYAKPEEGKKIAPQKLETKPARRKLEVSTLRVVG